MRLPIPIAEGLAPKSGATAQASASAGRAAWLQRHALAALAREGETMIGIAVALPFCAVHCLCCERDVRAGQPPQVLQAYTQRLCSEIDLLAQHIGKGHELMRLHLGGGSANLLDASCLAGLVHALRQHWRMPRDAELSVECDPRRAGLMQLELLHGLGFDEVQFGVLDLAPAVQRAIGRLHSRALIDDACGLARACGIERVHLRLMVGLPEQTLDSWRDTLQQVIAMAPSRISVQRYRHRPWLSPGQCTIDTHALPGADEVQALLALSADLLGKVGYRWLGADLFVLEDDPLSLAADSGALRSSLVGHTALPAMPLLGLGCGAISDLGGTLLWNLPRPEAWQAEVDAGRLPVDVGWQAGREALRRRAAAEHLLCHQELPTALLDDDLAPVYEALAAQAPPGSLLRLPDRLVLTATGRYELPWLCASLAGLPTDLPSPLPAWLN